jgi:hypothetical protein
MTVTRLPVDNQASRNDRTREALRWLGHVLGNCMGGDWDQETICDELGAAIFDGLSDDFGHVARQLDTLNALQVFHAALGREVADQARHAKARGATWEQIGKVFGTTRQAAQMRFGE